MLRAPLESCWPLFDLSVALFIADVFEADNLGEQF
jgi:hypothetical protein